MESMKSYIADGLAALITLAVGWSTDLLDGIAAKKFGSLRDRKPHVDIDGWPDIPLAFGASLVPVIYAYQHYSFTAVVFLTAIYTLSIIVGCTMVGVMGKPDSPFRQKVIAFNMIGFHGVYQITLTFMWFAYQVAGDTLAALALVVMCLVGLSQEKKIGAWAEGRFE